MYEKINRLLAAGSSLVIGLALFYACTQPHNRLKQTTNLPELPQNPDTTWLQTLQDTLQNLKTPMEQVNYLRNFAFSITDWGYNEVNTNHLFQQQALNLGQYYYLFKNDLAGVYCGGAAHFLQLLYNRFGFEAVQYDMGGNDHNSHVVLLVKVNQNWYVRDSYYYLTYLYAPDSTELDFCRLLKLLHQGRHDSVIVQQSPDVPNSDFLFRSNSVRRTLELNADYCNVLEEAAITPVIYYNYHSPAKIKVVFPRDFFLLNKLENDSYAQFLNQQGLPPNFVYLFLFPKNNLVNVQCN